MTRLQAEKTLVRLRAYREKIDGDINARIDKHMKMGPTLRRARNTRSLTNFIDRGHERIRLMNARIDEIEAFFPRTA